MPRLLIVLALAAPLAAFAQGYPLKPVRVIVPFAPGGATDTVGRLVAQKLSEGLGQPVVVENRPGVSGIAGIEAVARSAPDGYTLLQTVEALVINPSIYKKLPYDVERDFTPVSLTSRDPAAIAVHPSVPARSLGELIAYGRSYPGKLNIGTSNRMAAELFKQATGIDAQIIMYKGAALAVNDAIGGQVQIAVNSLGAFLPHLRSERLRIVALTDAVRHRGLPDIPTAAETVPGYEAVGWTAVLGPAGLAQPIVTRLAGEIAKVARSPDFQARLDASGNIAASSTPEELGAWIRAGLEKWRRVTQTAGIKPD